MAWLQSKLDIRIAKQEFLLSVPAFLCIGQTRVFAISQEGQKKKLRRVFVHIQFFSEISGQLSYMYSRCTRQSNFTEAKQLLAQKRTKCSND